METMISIIPLIINALILVGIVYAITRAVKRSGARHLKREQEIQADQAALRRRVEELEAEIEELKK